MTRRIPFKISARTARLIGRQNFSNAEGAIIELIKNSYDADASTCIVVFDNRYAVLPNILTPEEYTELAKEESLIAKYYHQENDQDYELWEAHSQTANEHEENQDEIRALREFFLSLCKIYVIDNGEGMTSEIIENYWMTIGTNNKEEEIFTQGGRIKTGEKGIGRFALDRLGNSAKMITKPDLEIYPEAVPDRAFLWQVDWRAFEESAKTLNQVEADLASEELANFAQNVESIVYLSAGTCPHLDIGSFETGTIIEISDLRDEWDDYSVSSLFTNLGVLIPPREERAFDIFLFSKLTPDAYGQVSSSVCDDYDCKVVAKIKPHGKSIITIYRNEFDASRIPEEVFSREKMKEARITAKGLKRGKSTRKRTISELVPGLAEIDDRGILENIGEFEFVFYFMKKQKSKRDDPVYFYKAFNATARRVWFEQFGGIKLFRDGFRVRPYGEVESSAFDWLQLGDRAAGSPAGIGKKGGGWRVRPNQITGVIKISRLTNIQFEDKSNRDGLHVKSRT